MSKSSGSSESVPEFLSITWRRGRRCMEASLFYIAFCFPPPKKKRRAPKSEWRPKGVNRLIRPCLWHAGTCHPTSHEGGGERSPPNPYCRSYLCYLGAGRFVDKVLLRHTQWSKHYVRLCNPFLTSVLSVEIILGKVASNIWTVH